MAAAAHCASLASLPDDVLVHILQQVPQLER
jgi:hypothetical protein